jgi:YbbR domain-containing protein
LVGGCHEARMSWLVGNWRLKLLAVALAVGLLTAVAFSENPPQVTHISTGVSYNNVPPGLVLVNPQTTVQITVAGLANAVRQFQRTSSVGAVVDMTNAHAGSGQTYNAKVTTTTSNVSVSPETVPVTLDIERIVSEQLPVTVMVPNVQRQIGIAVVPDGTYATCGSDQQACKVTVTGPEKVLSGLKAYVSFDLGINGAGIERAPALPVKFQKDGKPFDLKGIPTNPEIVTVAPDAVTARVQTEGGAMTKTVAIVVKASGQPACGYRVDGLTISPNAFADITGAIGAVNKINALYLDAVNIAGATSTQTFTRDLGAGVSGVSVVSPSSGQVTVTVSVSQAFSCSATAPNAPTPSPTPRPSPSTTP